MPMAITLTSEYSPERSRSFLVTMMFCGFTIGGAFGGLAAAGIIATYGWQGVLILGGVLPLVLAAVLVFVLPESVRYLVLKGGQDARVGENPASGRPAGASWRARASRACARSRAHPVRPIVHARPDGRHAAALAHLLHESARLLPADELAPDLAEQRGAEPAIGRLDRADAADRQHGRRCRDRLR